MFSILMIKQSLDSRVHLELIGNSTALNFFQADPKRLQMSSSSLSERTALFESIR